MTGTRGGFHRRWRTTVNELAFITAAALLYTLVRGLTDDRVPVAFANADAVISFERDLGIFVEPSLQAVVLEREFMIDVINAVYIAYWPIVVGTLAWVMFRHPGHYPLYRNAVLTSGSVSLVIFALYPLAPPRFLPEHGFVDTIAANSAGYRDFNASALVNEYAAMPSLHVGWVLLVSIAIIQLGRSRAVRATAAVLPVAMFGATVLTGNHYIVDGLAGGMVVLLGLATAGALRRRPARAHPTVSARQTAASDHRPAHQRPLKARSHTSTAVTVDPVSRAAPMRRHPPDASDTQSTEKLDAAARHNHATSFERATRGTVPGRDVALPVAPALPTLCDLAKTAAGSPRAAPH